MAIRLLSLLALVLAGGLVLVTTILFGCGWDWDAGCRIPVAVTEETAQIAVAIITNVPIIRNTCMKMMISAVC